ncbi:unnamed protein product [Phaedon cochleariae]|uniref:Methyltransferase type 12 domain-containing protein n=1 Tax=Phaedon cochleariae TaxID=80249 RepID=A0A9P0DTY4_PHACE|nr:unnamed protein product [Phaedon cochleariae]
MIQPELWSRNNNITILANMKYMEKYKDKIKWKDGESILEFGMGCGRNTREVLLPHLPENFKEYIGSDVTTPMVEHSRRTIIHQRMKIIQFDIECDSIPPEFVGRFDHIFSFMVMHWIQNTRQAFSNMYRMLKPGAEMFLTFGERISGNEFYDTMSRHPKWEQYGHEKLISPFHFCEDVEKEYRTALQESGFTDYDFESEHREYQFPNEQAFDEFCYSINPIIAKIPEEDKDEYKKVYLEMMKKNSSLNFIRRCEKTGQNLFHSSYKLFVVLARKPNN